MTTLDPELADRIGACPDPALRNLQITWGYHQLARQIVARIGAQDVPWPGFGVWASRTAGRMIRGEPLAFVDDLLEDVTARIDRVVAWMPSRLRPRLHRAPAYLLRAVSGDVAAALGRGNQQIWAELGPLFLSFREVLDDAVPFDVWSRRQLQPGPSAEGGQAYLAQALAALLRARDSRTPKARAERMFAFNTMTGYHEQVRVQVEIDKALSAPVRTVARVLAELDDDDEESLMEELAERTVAAVLSPLVGGLTRLVRYQLTRRMMTFDLPTGPLPLGVDLAPDPSGRAFPPDLERLDTPEARLACHLVDRSPDSLRGTGAEDWADLEERMDFIVDLFRSRQQTVALLDAPYSASQVEALLAGRIPDGPL